MIGRIRRPSRSNRITFLIGERVQVVVNVPDGPPVVRCVHCEASGSIGSVDPFAKCPDRGDGAPDTDVETVPAP